MFFYGTVLLHSTTLDFSYTLHKPGSHHNVGDCIIELNHRHNEDHHHCKVGIHHKEGNYRKETSHHKEGNHKKEGTHHK